MKNDFIYIVKACFSEDEVVLGHWLSLGTAKSDVKRFDWGMYSSLWIEKVRIGRYSKPIVVWQSK